MAAKLSFMAAACVVAAGVAHAASFSVVYGFKGGVDGAAPYALTAAGGRLFGATGAGGGTGCFGQGCGTVFAIDPKTGVETVLYRFAGTVQMAGMVYSDGFLYGAGESIAGSGAVYRLNLKTRVLSIVHQFSGPPDGATPVGNLLVQSGYIYGVTEYGGLGAGTVYKINLSTGVETVLHRFTNRLDGGVPYAGLIYHGGWLYGSAQIGGSSQNGVVFKMTPEHGVESVLYAFTGAAGNALTPQATLTYAGGQLYDTTGGGGIFGYGTVFTVAPATGKEAVILSFSPATTGGDPSAALLADHGFMYTTTFGGGTAGLGTLVRIDRLTHAATVLHNFSGGSDGQSPTTGLVQDGRTLFGMVAGGAGGNGLVYKITP